MALVPQKCQVFGCEEDFEYIVSVRNMRDWKNYSTKFGLCYEHYTQMGNDLNLDMIGETK